MRRSSLRRPGPPPPARHPAARPWNDNWDRLVSSSRAGATLARWAGEDPVLAAPDLPTLLVAAGAGAREGIASPAAEAVLGALVRRAPTDPVAARVVLQRVLPGLVLVAGRRARAAGAAIAEVLDDVVATAWTVIVTYPVARRPAKFAANIVRDAEYACFVRSRRLKRVVEELADGGTTLELRARCALDGRPEGDRVNPSETVLALLLDARRRGLSADDADLLHALYVELRGTAALADTHAIGVRALRYRRRAAIRRLAALAA